MSELRNQAMAFCPWRKSQTALTSRSISSCVLYKANDARSYVEVKPSLTEEHADLVESFVSLREMAATQSILEKVHTRNVPYLPYYGGQLRVSEDRTKIEACDGEQEKGLERWLVLLLEHLLVPSGYDVNGTINWESSEMSEDRGTLYVKNGVLEVVDVVSFCPGPSWKPNHYIDEALKLELVDLLASADTTGCTPDLTVVSAAPLSRIRDTLTKASETATQTHELTIGS